MSGRQTSWGDTAWARDWRAATPGCLWKRFPGQQPPSYGFCPLRASLGEEVATSPSGACSAAQRVGSRGTVDWHDVPALGCGGIQEKPHEAWLVRRGQEDPCHVSPLAARLSAELCERRCVLGSSPLPVLGPYFWAQCLSSRHRPLCGHRGWPLAGTGAEWPL